MHFYFSCPRSWCWFTIHIRISHDIKNRFHDIMRGRFNRSKRWTLVILVMVMIQYWLSLLLLLFSLLSWVFLNKNTKITIGFFLTINDKLFSLLILIIGITLFSFLLSTIPYYYYQYYHDNQLWLSLASSVRWWSEDARRGSALVADAANHTVGMPRILL